MRELPTPISVEEALRDTRLSLDVPEGTELTVGPFEEQFFEAFHLVEVRLFDDLQQLGFINREISEERMIGAIRADDQSYRESLERVTSHNSSCSCERQDHQQEIKISRRQFQNNLINLLQPLHRDLLQANDPAVIHPYHHARAWLSRASLYIVGIYSLLDINIGDSATLIMTPTVQALYANDINIGKNGRLRFTSGGVHVKCKTLNGPNRFSDLKLVEKYVSGLSREIRRNVQ